MSGILSAMDGRTYPLVYPPPAVPVKKVRQRRPWKPKGSFRFFGLPSEIRIRIYELSMFVPRTVDLDPENRKDVAYSLDMLQVCRRIHDEAFPIFYGLNTFRIFPTSPQFFNTKKVLLTRLPVKYRNVITKMELRVGPGWSKPPKCWNMGEKLGLKDCTSLRHLRIFVEVDPAGDIFKGFRVDDRFYTLFCGNILEELLEQVPTIQEIEFEAFPSVRKDTPLMVEMMGTAEAEGKKITFKGCWDENRKKFEMECEALELRLAQLSISGHISQIVI